MFYSHHLTALACTTVSIVLSAVTELMWHNAIARTENMRNDPIGSPPHAAKQLRGNCVDATGQPSHCRRQPTVAGLATSSNGKVFGQPTTRLPGRCHAWIRENNVRPTGDDRTAEQSRCRAGYRRCSHRAPQGSVDPGRGNPRSGPGPEIFQHQPADLAGVSRRDDDLRSSRRTSDTAPGAHRRSQNLGDL